MTIKEYLKDHSERELWDIIMDEAPVPLGILRGLTKEEKVRWEKLLHEKNIEIEEEDYLKKARDLRRSIPPTLSPGYDIHTAIDILSFSIFHYEKAINQLQEKLNEKKER